MKHAATEGDNVQQDDLGGRKIYPEQPWPRWGQTFDTDTRSRLRAVHAANLYRRERRLGFWFGLGMGWGLGAAFVGGAIWLAEVLR